MPEPMQRQFIFVIGTRAQLIKVAPVVVECERRGMLTTLLMTGQHKETMQDLIDEFSISSRQVEAFPASERLTIRSLLRWLPQAYRGLEKQLKQLKQLNSEQYVLVHGDTLSTLLGAFAAKRCGARVVHLESGLTSGKLFNPFPEEICRRLVFRMTDVAMCPDARAAKFMRSHHKAQVVDTGGNTIVDAVNLACVSDVLGGVRSPYLVASLHRFQNIYNTRRLQYLVGLIIRLAGNYPVHFVLHPATRKRLDADGLMAGLVESKNVKLLPRMGYRDFLRMVAGAACVLTDGGSNQEELAALGVPTLVMREYTERQDGLGGNAMMEADIQEGVESFVQEGHFEQLRKPPATFPGNGPSHRIATFLEGNASIPNRPATDRIRP
jgi:UDP-N-acetylglucosamine 2-epimerase (non-hydrolysing)